MFKAKPKKAKIDIKLIPVLTYDKLLESDKHTELLKSIRSLINLATPEYEALYLKTIINFAEYVQRLPETTNSYYAHSGGLLDHGLDRAHMALTLCRSYFSPADTNAIVISAEHERWLYAIFTVALLLDVGKPATKEVITLFDSNGKKLKEWQPSISSMTHQAAYYRYEFTKDNFDRLRSLYTPLLARQLLANTQTSLKITKSPALNGFDWLAADKEVLEAWLAMLTGDRTGTGFLLTIIPIVEAQTIANYFTEHNKLAAVPAKNFFADKDSAPITKTAATAVIHAPQSPAAQPANATPASPGMFQPAEVAGTSGYTVATAATATFTGSVAASAQPLAAGLAFLNWLKTKIQAQSWINNPNAAIQRTKEGLFLAIADLTQEFCREVPKYQSSEVVYDQFKQLEVIQGGNAAQTYYAENAVKKFPQGFIINPYIAFSQTEWDKIPQTNKFIKVETETVAAPAANAVTTAPKPTVSPGANI